MNIMLYCMQNQPDSHAHGTNRVHNRRHLAGKGSIAMAASIYAVSTTLGEEMVLEMGAFKFSAIYHRVGS